MWSRSILLGIFFPSLILGLDNRALEFSVNYFRYRSDQFICLLHCGEDNWTRSFTKQAAVYNARVSVHKTDNSSNMASLTACLKHTFVNVGVLVDPTCPEFERVMYYASENSLLDSKHQWLIMHRGENSTIANSTRIDLTLTPVLNTIAILNISVDSDIVLAMQGPESFELHELYNFGKIQGGELNIKTSGMWSTETSFTVSLNDYKYYRRWDFSQWPMRLMVVVANPSSKFDPKILTDTRPTPGVTLFLKTGTAVVTTIAELHNIRFVYSLAERWIGEYSINKTKILVGAALYFKEQDITPVLRYLDGLNEKVDFLPTSVTSLETRYYYRIPTFGAGKFENQFLRPLSTGAWVTVIVVVMMCACVLGMAAKLEKRPSAGQYGFFSVIATICQQFFDDNFDRRYDSTERKSEARKLTIFVTGISCVLIYNYYTSSVVSWLLSGPPPSINSLQELLESPLDLIFEDVAYTKSWLLTQGYYYNKRNAKIEDELKKKKVFNKKNIKSLLMPAVDGIKLVKAGGFAFHTEVDSANRLISETFTQPELCELGSLKSMEKTLLYPCLQKNSPYKEFFAWSTMRLFERGVIKCIQQRFIPIEVKCEGSSPRALALGGAAPAFLLLAVGYLIATVIMLVERALWRRKSKSIAFQLRK